MPSRWRVDRSLGISSSKQAAWNAYSRMIASALSFAFYVLWRSIRTAPRSAVISTCKPMSRLAIFSSFIMPHAACQPRVADRYLIRFFASTVIDAIRPAEVQA